MHLLIQNHNFLLVNSSNFKKYCISFMINLLLNGCLKGLFLLCMLNNSKVQKFYKGNIKVGNAKSIEWLNTWLNYFLFSRVPTLKTTQYSMGNPYFTFSMQNLLEASMFPSVKITAIPVLPKKKKKKVPFHHIFLTNPRT